MTHSLSRRTEALSFARSLISDAADIPLTDQRYGKARTPEKTRMYRSSSSAASLVLASTKVSTASVSELGLPNQLEPPPRDTMLVARRSPRPSVSGAPNFAGD